MTTLSVAASHFYKIYNDYIDLKLNDKSNWKKLEKFDKINFYLSIFSVNKYETEILQKNLNIMLINIKNSKKRWKLI